MTTKTYTNGHKPKTEYGDKLPPQDKEAERALLGGLFIDPGRIHEITPILSKADFYVLANGLIFDAICRVSNRGEYADIINVMSELRTLGHADIGDGQYQAEAYLAGLINAVPWSLGITSYARTIAEMATRRRLISAGQVITTVAWDEQHGIDEVLETSRQAVFSVAEKQTGRGLAHVSGAMSVYIDDMTERITNPQDIPGLQSGFIDLDKLLNGFKKQNLIIIAGRPGMGKTGLMLAMVDEMTINRKKRGAFFSLEMSKDELITRLIARRVKIDTQRLEQGKLTEQEQPNFFRESGVISQAPLFIDDSGAVTPAMIRAQAMRQAIETGIDYLMVDYLGLVSVPGSKSRYEQVSEAARFFKNLAKELEIPVIVASQLNRALENRADKRPQLADLRDSGEIEEAANVVISLYRDDYYNPDDSLRPNIVEVEILKHRGGPTGVCDLFWHAQLATCRNLQRAEVKL